jgi:hypothetical protein
MVAALLAPVAADAQPARDARVSVTVTDPSGAIMSGVTVIVTPIADASTPATGDGQAGPPSISAVTTNKGVATLTGLARGRYAIAAQPAVAGFDTGILPDVTLRRGNNAFTIVLPLTRVQDAVTVAQDAQAAASDPRGNALTSVLAREEIDALSDDPAEMLQQLLDLAGGNANVRVDGFAGAALPPKALIQSIQVSRDRFAAEHHSPDFDDIEIVTKAGVGPLHGGLVSRVRDGSMSGRSPFTSTKGPERTQRYQGDIGGSLVPHRASFSLSGGVVRSFDTPILTVALPDADPRASLLNVRRPSDSWMTYDLLDVALTPTHLLRTAYVQNELTRSNLGIGAYDLPSRAYTARSSDREVRLQDSGPLGPRLLAQTRLKLHWNDTATHAGVEAPTLRVLDAFTSGGAQMAGGRQVHELELASDIDIAVRAGHALRAGVLIEGGTFRSDEASNYLGTYTFTSLATYEAGQPASYTRRIGNPLIAYRNLRAGAYLQDDVRVSKSLTLSAGVRYEAQTHVRDLWNIGPRGAVTWAPFKHGKTTIRSSAGLFYDWLGPNTYEQTLRVDGVRQQELTLLNPAYPVPLLANDGTGSAAPPSNRYLLGRNLLLPRTTRIGVDLDQALSRRVRVSVGYYNEHDDRMLRGQNVNAPIDGLRPDSTLANVIEVVSDAAFRGQQVQTNLTVNLPPRAVIRASYTFSKQMIDTDTPFTVSPTGSLATEWGPASFNRRHRLAASVTSQAINHVTATLSLAANTGTPYTITSGLDANGDGIFNDRPAGIGRNSVRGSGQYALSANLSYALGLGTRPPVAGEKGGPQPRVRLSWTVSATNLTNHANYTGFSGVMTSPFFLQPTAVQNPRKIDIGMTCGF